MQPARLIKDAAPARVKTEEADAEHQESDSDHDAERPEHQPDLGPVFARHGIEAFQRRIERMLEDQRRCLRDFDGVFHLRFVLIGNAEQDQWCAIWMALEVPFHRHHLNRLMLERVEAVLVSGEDLDRRHQRGHPHRHREHHAGAFQPRALQKMIGADGADHEGGGEICRQHHVDEAIGKGWIEDHLPPVGGDELALRVHRKACRRLHPRVGRQDPERRDQCADGDHEGRDEMQLVADTVEPEQHDAEKARFKKEGGQHLVSHQRADDRSGLVREHRPVGAELVGHHDAGDDAHAEGDSENLQPVVKKVDENFSAGP